MSAPLYNILDASEVKDLWLDLSEGLFKATQLRQILIICVAITLAFTLHRLFRPKNQSSTKTISLYGFHRVLFPIAALLVVETGKHFLHPHQSVRLLNIATSLLIALTIIRAAVYFLRNIFNENKWLRISEKSLVSTIWLGFALHITGQLQWIIHTLDELSIPLGKHSLSLLMLINGALSISITLIIALWVGRTLERRILSSDVLDSSLRVMLAKLSRALLLVIGVMIALPLVGIDLTLFSVFGGALGVGLGLGLQKIASNYVSGFIILMDRSIRLGNFITVDNKYGEVTRLTARYLVLRQSDGTEAIIPNDTLITSVVLNHSYSDQNMLVQITLLIANNSNIQLAQQIMSNATKSHPRILQVPSPNVVYKTIRHEGVELELSLWLSDPQNGTGQLRSDLLQEIHAQFKSNQIELAPITTAIFNSTTKTT
ncbi:mechanosensitive ion channel [Leeia sp. TBRC 13508]|uniref:Mechanosensitive ion channel n=1 Tax=Leeia speluncae TaxID=2884804 RepID=A0ABS8D2Y7_9NEIS|nr:mechanosensitive ion channel domain-containing protein [Leeia speluncae]MCB6182545.1 mechanosensitive ion channel [Leeia speluncae]